MGRSSGSGSRGLITLDAIISLIILATIILLIPMFNQNLDLAIAYKEASDISQVIILTNSISDPIVERAILERTNPNLQMKVVHGRETIIVKWNSPKNQFVIERPVFDGKMKEVRFVFGY